ncbi:MAG: hypothetical protein WAP03_15360 [Methylorubrum rhodinum]|uniref:hypothetical protein n=1 Tax=Methylorubrum rhodinum TaxID=29428 RepID=UPI003BAEEA4E
MTVVLTMWRRSSEEISLPATSFVSPGGARDVVRLLSARFVFTARGRIGSQACVHCMGCLPNTNGVAAPAGIGSGRRVEVDIFTENAPEHPQAVIPGP